MHDDIADLLADFRSTRFTGGQDLALGPLKKISTESIRRAGGALARWLAKNNVAAAGLELDGLFGLGLPPVAALNALAEGLLLGAFTFSRYKAEDEAKTCALNLLTSQAGQAELEAALRKAGLANGKGDGIKILGDGALSKKLTVVAHKFSASAKEKIEAAGGSVTEA